MYQSHNRLQHIVNHVFHSTCYASAFEERVAQFVTIFVKHLPFACNALCTEAGCGPVPPTVLPL